MLLKVWPEASRANGRVLVSVMPGETLTSRKYAVPVSSMMRSVRDRSRRPNVVCAVIAILATSLATSLDSWARTSNSVLPGVYRAVVVAVVARDDLDGGQGLRAVAEVYHPDRDFGAGDEPFDEGGLAVGEAAQHRGGQIGRGGDSGWLRGQTRRGTA